MRVGAEVPVPRDNLDMRGDVPWTRVPAPHTRTRRFPCPRRLRRRGDAVTVCAVDTRRCSRPRPRRRCHHDASSDDADSDGGSAGAARLLMHTARMQMAEFGSPCVTIFLVYWPPNVTA
ncbi:hypothetical protein FB451DRAFT_1405479 [Mycena latifolia]|nr:hypothetical protein FB451DRAFT_1405479 [Mycena latifolia]